MAENRTLDNPNDISIREDQARVRLSLGKEKGAQKDVLAKAKFSASFTFRFRQFQNTQFSGLWELAIMKANGKVEEVICDADGLPNALEAIGNIFANKGF